VPQFDKLLNTFDLAQKRRKRRSRFCIKVESEIYEWFCKDLPRREIKLEISKNHDCPTLATLSMRIVEYRTALVDNCSGRNSMDRCLSLVKIMDDLYSKCNFDSNKEAYKIYVYGLKVSENNRIIFQKRLVNFGADTLSSNKTLPYFTQSKLNIHLIVIPEYNLLHFNEEVVSIKMLEKFIRYYDTRRGQVFGCKDGGDLFFEETIFRFQGIDNEFV
jgi:hypothetical protein